ncbi:MAG: ferritin [Tissierellia bacterium]|nr:ferritin [Tissierellia bacterium]
MTKLLDNMNAQMNREYESAYIYKGMAIYAAGANFRGATGWMEKQADEEVTHAEKFKEFLLDLGYQPKLTGMEEAKTEYKSLADIFEAALDHEKFISKNIRDLYKQAVEEANYEVQVFLNWFIEEQVEEEASVGEIVDLLEMVGDSKNGLFMLDAQLGRR